MLNCKNTNNKLLRHRMLTTIIATLMPLMMWAQTDITDLSSITNMAGHYRLAADVSGAGHSTIAGPFTGTLEASIDPSTQMPYRITGLDAPLFEMVTGTVSIDGSNEVFGSDGVWRYTELSDYDTPLGTENMMIRMIKALTQVIRMSFNLK